MKISVKKIKNNSIKKQYSLPTLLAGNTIFLIRPYHICFMSILVFNILLLKTFGHVYFLSGLSTIMVKEGWLNWGYMKYFGETKRF